MPENNVPSAKPEPEAAPGEFDFAAPITERPRVKRRALEQATPAKSIEAAPAKTIEAEVRQVENTTKPSPSPTKPTTTSTPYVSPAAKAKTASTPAASPHGTRPATLYYSSGTRQDKETSSPMKTTPSPSSSSTSSPSTSSTTSTAARPATTATRAPSVSDYRSNAERQSREQKSVGDVLSVLVYTLMAVFVLGFSLAGYGAYVITKQLNKQSVTMNDFDKRYASDYTDINSRLTTTQENLTQAQAEIARQQDLIVKQQDALNKLIAAMDDNTSAIKQERATRAQETANLRSRLKDLEYQGPTTRKY